MLSPDACVRGSTEHRAFFDLARRTALRLGAYAWPVSPKPKHELAEQHLAAAAGAIDDERINDAVNALFYAAEAAVSPSRITTGSTPSATTR